MQVDPVDEAARWFGNTQIFSAFHWHGETFSLPPGATHLLSSAGCTQQAYSMGKHIGLQCHIEMTPSMVRDWCLAGFDEIAQAADSPGVQSAAAILENLEARTAGLHVVADRVYARWVEGLI